MPQQQLSRWLSVADGQPEDEHPPEALLEFSEAELFLATHVFDAGERLGPQAYSDVYRGVMRGKHEVAIKVLELGGQEAQAAGVAEEVRLLSRLSHDNLAKVVGWATGAERCYLVYELVAGCDVAERLRCCQENGTGFDWAERLWIAADVAEGLAFMHGSSPQMLHRNLKSANVILGPGPAGVAKLVDFGLSGIERAKAKVVPLNHQLGTPGDACPEDVRSGAVTEQTEVYALGLFLLELLLNLPPVCLGEGGEFIYPVFQEVMPQAPGALERALAALDPLAGWPPALVQELTDLALACVASKAVARPCAAEAVARLREQCDKLCQGRRTAGSAAPGGHGGAQTRPAGPQHFTVKIASQRQLQVPDWTPQGGRGRRCHGAARSSAAQPAPTSRYGCFWEWGVDVCCRVGCERVSAADDEGDDSRPSLPTSEESVYRL